MKTINYIVSCLLAVFSPVQMFYLAKNDLHFVMGFLCMIASIIFFLFALIEEKNEEISHLRQTILRYRDQFMMD